MKVTPHMRRRIEVEIAVSRFVTRTMGRIPVVGRLMATFWTCLATEGLRATVKPRWGAMTWAFLNDGYRPTVWHVWQQMNHGVDHPYTGIWPDGAPRSKAEADAMLARFAGWER